VFLNTFEKQAQGLTPTSQKSTPPLINVFLNTFEKQAQGLTPAAPPAKQAHMAQLLKSPFCNPKHYTLNPKP